MDARHQEVQFSDIQILLEYEQIRQPFLIDNEILSWTVAKVKRYVLSLHALAHVNRPAYQLDMVILIGQGMECDKISPDETVLRDADVFGNYFHCLQAGHTIVLTDRRWTWQDFLTDVKIRAGENCHNSGVCLAILLAVVVIGVGLCFGVNNA